MCFYLPFFKYLEKTKPNNTREELLEEWGKQRSEDPVLTAQGLEQGKQVSQFYANILNDNSQAELNYKNFLDRFPDHELAPSVQFELDHLGKDINEIDVLKHITS